MLKQRVITAILLTFGFLSLLLFAPWSIFTGVVAGVFLVGAWEWSDLSGVKHCVARALYVVLIAATGLACLHYSDYTEDLNFLRSVLIAACAWWALALLWIQSYPSSAVLWQHSLLRLLMGCVVLVPAWLSVVVLRSLENGISLIFMCLIVVASVDVGAYFTGKKFGRRKLAPNVSPGKTWEGVWGGVCASLVCGLAIGFFSGVSTNLLLLACVVLPSAMISIVGDLLESMVKRNRGIKDSGKILPGHGGVLDRIDGLTSALPVFSLALIAATL